MSFHFVVNHFSHPNFTGKRSIFIPIPKKGNAKECSHYHTIHIPARLCSKSFKLGFSSMWTENFQMCKLDLEKAEEPEIKLPTFTGSWKQQENSRQTSALLTTPKPLTVWITTNCGKLFKRWQHQTTLPASWETCIQVKKKKLEPDIEQ